ncbi:hypothetical protein TNCV_2937331 [Trichonephila clavipes]|nr:hypothetical protein TNCV_2937311 [Trichonephila clavipes]GFV08520.1 hypothetical protein TNCV_2937331 [Trichonephila clavipes]
MYALIGEKLVALVPYEEANIFALKNVGQLLGLYRPVSSPVSTFFSPRSHSLLLRACIYKYFEETPNLCLCPEKNERTYDENWDDVPVEANGPTLPLTPLHGQ